MLAGLILPDSGSASVHGVSIENTCDVKKMMGLVAGEERSFFWRLSGKDNLMFFGRLHALSDRRINARIRELGQRLELTDYLERRVDTYSTGIKQRLGIARALLHNPAILFMDEPSKSLDPASTDVLHKLIQRICHEEGKTILLITHQMDEAEFLCDRIAIMHEGRITLTGDMPTLRKAIHAPQVIECRASQIPASFIAHIQTHPHLKFSQHLLHGETQIRITIPDEQAHLIPGLLQNMISADINPTHLSLEPLGLDDIFKQYTGRKIASHGEEQP